MGFDSHDHFANYIGKCNCKYDICCRSGRFMTRSSLHATYWITIRTPFIMGLYCMGKKNVQIIAHVLTSGESDKRKFINYHMCSSCFNCHLFVC